MEFSYLKVSETRGQANPGYKLLKKVQALNLNFIIIPSLILRMNDRVARHHCRVSYCLIHRI